MKKISVIVIVLISIQYLNAQDFQEAFLLSQNYNLGTARSAAMGNAFGALGGDFSSIGTNPGGIGVYRSSEFSFGGYFSSVAANANYLGTPTSNFQYNSNLNNVNYVSTYKTGLNEGWVSVSFGLGYNKVNDFNNVLSINGTTVMHQGGAPNASMSDYFAELGNLPIGSELSNSAHTGEQTNWNQNNPSTLDPYFEGLALAAHVINYDSAQGNYISSVPNTPITKNLTQTNTGSTGDWSFSVGGNYSNKLFIGASFSFMSLNYRRVMNYTENFTPQNGYNSFNFLMNNAISGTGFNFKVGAIFKPVEFIRVGLAFHSPTFYSINENLSTSITTNDSGTWVPGNNGYPLSSAQNNYSFSTPMKTVGSVALTVKNIGIISFDCDMLDYTNMKFSNGADASEISSRMRTTFNFRLGAEVKLGSIYLRAGGALYQSPYKSTAVIGSTNGQAYSMSCGVGYRTSRFFVDFALVQFVQQEKYYMWDDVNYDKASFSTNTYTTNRGTVTVGFRF